MMEFIMMTLSFTVGILLASVLAFVIMLQPKVMKWYTKLMMKTMNNMAEITEEVMLKDL